MNKRSPLVTAAVVAAFALVGCGDDKKESASTAATAPKMSPADEWAQTLCVRIGAQVKELQPPKVAEASPAETKAELVRFFDQVADQLDAQAGTLKEVGAPPTKEGKEVWSDARKELGETRRKVKNLRRSIRGQDFSSSSDVSAGMDKLASDFKVLNSYLGPVSDMSKDPELKMAFLSDPNCANLSG